MVFAAFVCDVHLESHLVPQSTKLWAALLKKLVDFAYKLPDFECQQIHVP